MASPHDVKSPKAHWTLIDVLHVADNPENGGWAIALGEWKAKRRLACRWNGKDKGLGNPSSRGVPTWFILPDEFVEPLMKSGIIPGNKRALVSALLTKAA